MTRSLKDILMNRDPITIEVSNTGDAIRASVKGQRHLYAFGETASNAIGDLVRFNGAVFGVKIEHVEETK